MSLHLHRARQWTGWTLAAFAMAPFTLFLGSPTEVSHTVPVTGRVRYSGRPLNDATICLDVDGQHSAYAMLEPDGSFRVVSMTWIDEGVAGPLSCASLHARERPEIPFEIWRSPDVGDPARRRSGLESLPHRPGVAVERPVVPLNPSSASRFLRRILERSPASVTLLMSVRGRGHRAEGSSGGHR